MLLLKWECLGIKIVQQIAILIGCGVLPHRKALVEIVEGGLEDEQQKVLAVKYDNLIIS